jgi:hypothetical protein
MNELPPPRTPPTQLVSVYEAVNDGRREIYLGTTLHLADHLTTSFRSTPPKAVAHWGPGEKIFINIVEYSIPQRDVAKFIDHYASSAASAGWTVHKGAA